MGVDLGFFDRRLDVIVDYWRRNSFDLIARFRTSGIGGIITKYANYADMVSSGYDVTIGVTPIRQKDYSWKTNFTIGYNKSEITNSRDAPSILNMVNNSGGNLEGYPVNGLFSIQYKGLDPKTGVPYFIDQNGEESMNVSFQSTNLKHLQFEGQVDPKFSGGWSNTFNWRDLTLNLFFTFQGGNKIRLAPQFKSNYNDLDALSNKFNDRWAMPGDEQFTNVPSIPDALTNSNLSGMYPYSAYNYSTERVAKGDFVRLKTLQLSYRLPKSLLQKSGFISMASLSLAGSNLWLIAADKKLNGQDPEFYNTGGVAQPISRQFTVSLNVGF